MTGMTCTSGVKNYVHEDIIIMKGGEKIDSIYFWPVAIRVSMKTLIVQIQGVLQVFP